MIWKLYTEWLSNSYFDYFTLSVIYTEGKGVIILVGSLSIRLDQKYFRKNLIVVDSPGEGLLLETTEAVAWRYQKI